MGALGRPARFGIVLLVASLGTGCLSNDTRPPPGSAIFTSTSDDALRDGFQTDDGWAVKYDRFVVSLGHASPEGEPGTCLPYSDAPYQRVLNMLVAGPQRVSILYGIGLCDIDFELSNPWADSVLGEGATAADRDFMRTPAVDGYSFDSQGQPASAAVSFFLRGTAEKGGTTKRFDWAYRHRIDYQGCYFWQGDVAVRGVDLHENEEIGRDLTVHGNAPFRDRLAPAEAGLAFEPFAAADDDGDGDGEVTLDEIGTVQLADIREKDRYADAQQGWTTLGAYVYQGLFTHVVQYQGDGDCDEKSVNPNDRAFY